MALILTYLLAFARSVPAAADLFRQIVAQLDADRARAAEQRLADKDAAVDAAIDGPKS